MLLLALVASGVVWIYQQREALGLNLVNQLLKAYQIDVTHIDGLGMSLRSVSANTIVFRLAQSNDLQIITHPELQFNISDIIRGQFKSLTAEQTSLSLSVPGITTPVRTDINQISIICQSEQHCAGSAQLQMDIGEFNAMEATIQSSATDLTSPIDFLIAGDQLNLSLPSGLQLSIANIDYGDYRFEHVNLLTNQPWDLQVDLSRQTFSLHAEDTHLMFSTRGAADAQTSISHIKLWCTSLDQCDIEAQVDVQINSFDSLNPASTLSGLGIASKIKMQYQASALNIISPANLKITLESGRYANYQVQNLDLVSAGPWEIAVDLAARNASVTAQSTTIKLPVIRTRAETEAPSLSGMTVYIPSITASMDFMTIQNPPWYQQLAVAANLNVSEVYTTLAPYNFWPYQWSAHLQWSEADQLRVELDATHSERKMFSINLEQRVNDLRGAATVNLEPLTFSASGARLSSYLSPLPIDADLLGGTLALKGNLAWHVDQSTMDLQTEGNIQIDAQALAGFVDEIVFSGLTSSSLWSLRSDGSIASQTAFPLNIREINPGIPLFNVQSNVSMDSANGLIQLQAPKADVFGGNVSADRLDILLPRENRIDELGETFVVTINSIDIAQVLSLSAYEQVTATGIISGVLPLRFKGLKPVIEAGKLSASQQGGAIRYHQGGTNSGNQNLDLVYQALEYYQYDTLSAGVDFDENGELILALQMQGQSPNVGQGQRINLNLNISDNIPALLQSLQAADNMAERLQDMLE